MAGKSSKTKLESQKPEPEEMSVPAEKPESEEKSESCEEPEEQMEGQGVEGDGDDLVSEKPKTLIAMRPILYLSKQYKAGDRLPVNNQEMVGAWIEAGSAAWQEPGGRQFP